MNVRRTSLTALLACAIVVPPVAAQEESEAPAGTAKAYDKRLMRLSEVLGSLHFLRPLCGRDANGEWRKAMSDILEVEKPNEQRRALLISRFNRGYETFRRSYRSCTPSAVRAANRYRLEGVRLTAQIVARHAR